MKNKKVITTQAFEDAVNKSSSDKIAIKDLIEAMESAGFGLAMMIFSFGIIIPFPPPFPSIIAIPLVIFSAQMLLGFKAPKLPKIFSNIKIKRSILVVLVQKSSPHIRKIEKFLRVRLSFIVTNSFSERIIGFFALLFSSCVFIPIPLSNFIPGLGILIISFGLIGKDGLIVIVGILIGLIGAIISFLAIFLGYEAINLIKDFIFN